MYLGSKFTEVEFTKLTITSIKELKIVKQNLTRQITMRVNRVYFLKLAQVYNTFEESEVSSRNY